MKKLFITFILGLGLLPCFTNAGEVNVYINSTPRSQTLNISSDGYDIHNNLQDDIVLCFDSVGSSNVSFDYFMFSTTISRNTLRGTCVLMFGGSSSDYLFLHQKSNTSVSLTAYEVINPSDCPSMTSLECQTQYNLIPISSVDSNYCTTNNLCPSNDCPIYTGDLTPGVSNIFINDVFHPGAFNVIINIPEEIDWDYAYTNSGSNINIDVVGYNQDTDYINAWIDTNNYKPTTDDFTNTFLLFKDYSGLLVALLFVILVFYFVKKLF